MAELFSLKDIGNLLELLDKHEVSEFKLEREGETLWLKRGETAVSQPQATSPIHQVFTSLPPQAQHNYQQPPTIAAPTAPATVAALPTAVASPDPGVSAPTVSKSKEVTSPMVGTFYRRPAVDAEPYVNVGDKVKKGQVLCIVEAMKLMNEIESEIAGTVVEVCLEDGQMVEYGEVLFRIDPL